MFLEICLPAEFSHSPNLTHIIEVMKWISDIDEIQSGLEVNCSGSRYPGAGLVTTALNIYFIGNYEHFRRIFPHITKVLRLKNHL